MYSIITNDLVYSRIKQVSESAQNTNDKGEPRALTEIVAAHEPFHLVEYRFTLQVMDVDYETKSVRRVVRESQIEEELAQIIKTYEHLYWESKVVKTETIFILKDLGSYNLAVVTPWFVKGEDRLPLHK